jgi:hypothetical protein
MVVTKFLEGQGLGNQLWVYAAGRSISEKLGRPHVVTGRDVFKGKELLELDWGNEKLLGKGTYFQFHEELFYDHELFYLAPDFDSRVTKLPERCYINGLFQSEDYFFGRLAELRNWIRTKDLVQKRSKIFADRLILNIRGGEYKRHKNLILPKTYWQHAITHLSNLASEKSFLIVTDDPPYARTLLPGLEIVTGIVDSWAALHGARAVAVSNSSFSYFPIKTRKDKPIVIAPVCWSRFDNLYKRWAGPANYYSDWKWMGPEGNIYNKEQCISLVRETRKHYNAYSIRTSKDYPINRTILSYVPKFLKTPLKKTLSILFPSKFGL